MPFTKHDVADFLDGAGHIGFYPAKLDYQHLAALELNKFCSRVNSQGLAQNERHRRELAAVRRGFIMHSAGQTCMTLSVICAMALTVYLCVWANVADMLALVPLLFAMSLFVAAKIRLAKRRDAAG